MRTAMFGALAVSYLVVGSAAALAQSNPSADSIINSLTPRSGVGQTTRGIRPMNPAPQAASPATPTAVTPPPAHLGTTRPAVAPTGLPTAPPPRPATEAAAPSVNLTVQFATNSAELTPAAIRTLDELGRALSSAQLATYRFRIEGHTDTVGTAEHNQSLSEQRANKVVDYLVNKFHVDRARLEPVGMGESHLLVQTGENIAEPRNRRVTVVNTGA